MVLSDNTVQKIFNYILLCNCFFKLRNKLFQQVIGITMRMDPAPFFANLFLHCYENKLIKK